MSTDESQQDRERAKRAQELVHLRENLPHMLEIIELNAAMIRGKYKALIRQGFTEQQAIELCKAGALT